MSSGINHQVGVKASPEEVYNGAEPFGPGTHPLSGNPA